MDRHFAIVQLIKVIEKGLADVEAAIRSHPPETIAVYESGKAGFLSQFAEEAQAEEIPNPYNFTLTERTTVFNYVLAMAFMSAWYHLYGDTKRRDQAAGSASVLLAQTGIVWQDALQEILNWETIWRGNLAGTKADPRRRVGCAGSLFVALGLIGWYVITGA